MPINSPVQRPPALFVLAVLVFLGFLLYRESAVTAGLPVFLPKNEKKIHVELLGESFVEGVYQLYDGSTLCDVIKLTEQSVPALPKDANACARPLNDGQSVQIISKDQQIEIVELAWMAASKRMALSISLHPDRMTLHDWTALPGIGEEFAARIEADRQKNGDFGSLENLNRVKGIGPKKIARWRRFFFDV